MTEVQRLDRVSIVDFDLIKDGEKLDAPQLTYYKVANFNEDGTITAKYLGEASSVLIDSYCKEVKYREGKWVKEDFESVRTARMIVVDRLNKKVTIVIESEQKNLLTND